MDRLTKKFNGEYYCKNANTMIFNTEIEYNTIQKLGKLEDLEKKLGCPLEVVFKALEEGINIPKYNLKHSTVSLVKIKTTNIWCFKVLANLYELKDYQKTWWLKGGE